MQGLKMEKRQTLLCYFISDKKGKDREEGLYHNQPRYMSFNMMPQFMGEDNLYFIRAKILHQGIRKDYPSCTAKPYQTCICCFTLFAEINLVDIPNPCTRAFAKSHQPSLQLLIL